eukprot:90108-Amphidinium_carterae.1
MPASRVQTPVTSTSHCRTQHSFWAPGTAAINKQRKHHHPTVKLAMSQIRKSEMSTIENMHVPESVGGITGVLTAAGLSTCRTKGSVTT